MIFERLIPSESIAAAGFHKQHTCSRKSLTTRQRGGVMTEGTATPPPRRQHTLLDFAQSVNFLVFLRESLLETKCLL